ncbi:hypothetical protein FHS27_000826 [Rhodopirellula rubra]|uniref:Uncharacterized protein n=1 Tax=Aporhodopirellula rubra TaxID=980271 RepID=A0A7W5H472_9BACT|nr:hypothetical protein [Aporhodopirellula rubra]MBB3205059.1 hypothetical protein [Aporhodopirellula rubra]
MLRRVDHPRSLTIELHFQVLFGRIGDRPSNTLRRVIPGGDSYCVAIRIRDRLDLARFVELIQVAVRAARPHSPAASDATAWNLNEVNWVSGPSDPNDCPLVTELVEVSSPQNLR